MTTIHPKISPLIPSQFPEHFREQGPNFVLFMQAYYEWMEQQNQALFYSRSILSNRDIDSTLDAFVKHFRTKYMAMIPQSTEVDSRFIVKHILDLYRTAGTPKAYELLFRLFFNQDIDLFIPSEYLFKPSDADWHVPQYIEVSSSDHHPSLAGKKIYGTDGHATGIVETFSTKTVNSRTVNVIELSSVSGKFKYGERIVCPEIGLEIQDAPIIVGSLSAIGIQNGGVNFSVGDVLNVTAASGKGALARVLSTTAQNGKVTFDLLDGGFGFSMNAAITVTGGGGSGASFRVGGLVNKSIIPINTDLIGDFYNTTLESSSSGFRLTVTGVSGTFTNGEHVSANSTQMFVDGSIVDGSPVLGETFTNTAASFSGTLYLNEQTGFMIQSPAGTLTPGVVLKGSTSNAHILVNCATGSQAVQGNGVIIAANSTSITVNLVTDFGGTNAGYFLRNSLVVGAVSSAVGTISNVTRLTDWNFPAVTSPDDDNFDSLLGGSLTTFDYEVGTIAFLSAVNPGINYSSNPTVSITENSIIQFAFPDGSGGIWGNDAVVSAIAGTANGIVTSVGIIDSGYGHESDEPLTLTTATNQSSVSGTSVVDTHGIGRGFWRNNKSFTSDVMALQDSYYYQQFSYEVITNSPLEAYKSLVEDLIHPAGNLLFGRYRFKDVQTNSASDVVFSTLAVTSSSVSTLDWSEIENSMFIPLI